MKLKIIDDLKHNLETDMNAYTQSIFNGAGI